jgi:hypothetical protein
MANYSQGDLFVNDLTVSSSRGSMALAKSFVSASVYESIFTPAILADIDVLDTDDLLGTLKLSGDETVTFSFTAPGTEGANYTFALHKLEDGRSTTGAQKSKMYTLKCVSEEAFHAKTNLVQKNYNTQISEIVKDIVKTYMHSSKNVDVEDTKGTQKILIPSLNPYKAIEMIKKRAVSDQNKSSTYIFFETRNGSTPTFKFTTIEKLFQGSPVKTFVQLNTVAADSTQPADNNILAYEVPNQFNATDRLAVGGKRRVSQFNMRTHDYETKDTTPNPTSFSSGGSGSYNSADFTNKYIDSAKIPPQSIVPVDAGSGQRPNTNIPQTLADQQAYIAVLMQNAVKIKVPGDTTLKAGDMITANIPNKSSFTGDVQNDKLLSGNFLISRIHHKIGEALDRPRYTCAIELIKGNMEEGV